jgi:hypothetical protein
VTALVIGVDPGMTTGVCALHIVEQAMAVEPLLYQAYGYEAAMLLVGALVDDTVWDTGLIAVERFVVSGRAGRSGSAAAGHMTRELIGALGTLGVQTFSRNAATVKTWATEKRLEAAGLLAATKGMGHARDAARHALYAGVHESLLADPLSSKVAVR